MIKKSTLLNNYTESGLHFTFDQRWTVFKFDQHRFYQYLSGQGLKGVDFLAADQCTPEILLLEVKNFAPKNWKGPLPTRDIVLENPEAYAKKIIKKYEDSIRLLKIINEYYEKKWWLSPLTKIFSYLTITKRFPSRDFILWPSIYHLLQQPTTKINLLLYLQWQEIVPLAQQSEFSKIVTKKINHHFAEDKFQFNLIDPQNTFPSITVNGR